MKVAKTTNNFIHHIRTAIFNLSHVERKGLFIYVAAKISNEGSHWPDVNYPHVLYVLKDLCYHKLFVNKPRKCSKSYFVVNYCNKLLDEVKLNHIFNNRDVRSLFPEPKCVWAAPTVTYSYTSSIRSKILNYNRAIRENKGHYLCKCSNYPSSFVDTHHGHIFTGNLNVIKNGKLRQLMNYGLNYHEQQPPDKEKVISSVKSALDRYINNVSNKLSKCKVFFQAWKSQVLSKVSDKLYKCKGYKYNNLLNQASVKKALSELHDDFAVIPVDKSGNNIALVCKKYYLDVMTEEITNSPTFEHVSRDIEQHNADLSIKIRKDLIGKDKLPTLYATAKMHKNPKAFRFITASRDTVTSPLSVAVSKCLKLLQKTARTSFKYQIKNIDNCVFIVDNRNKIIEFMDKCNLDKSKNKCVSTWDFSTLYTKIPHVKLKDKMRKFITKMFDINPDKEYITYNKKGGYAYYTKTLSKTHISFSCIDLINNVDIIIDNSYVIYNDNVYRQIVGIPMGTNCAPFLANLFLHVYEYEYIESLIEDGNFEDALALSKTYRYQDDCICLNDGGCFRRHFLHIYPKEMVLDCTNISQKVCTFLDLRISIFRGKFLYKSFDKRRDFEFKIIKYPNISGNIPKSPSYGVYTSQLVRFCQINHNAGSFFSDVREMTNDFCKKGFLLERLKTSYQAFGSKYLQKWAKYGVDITLPKNLNGIFSNS